MDKGENNLVTFDLITYLSICLNKLEQAERMTLWACMGRRELALVSSQVRVTSKKSDSARSSRKAPETFDSKSFQRRQKFSEEPILMPRFVAVAAALEKVAAMARECSQ